MTSLSVQITGMSCGHCVKAVQKALESLPGVAVQQVTVGTAAMTYDESATSAATIRDAIEDAGYTVTAGV